MNLHLKLGNKNIIHDYNTYCKYWIEGASDEWREVKGDFRCLPRKRKRLGFSPAFQTLGDSHCRAARPHTAVSKPGANNKLVLDLP
jgi:hypothetical protein